MASKLPHSHYDSAPPFVREVLQLYTDALPDVRFPDVDLASLESTAAQLQAARLELERIEAELERARTLLQQQTALMNAQAERALAYAHVFAAGNPELSARVAQVTRHDSLPPPVAAHPIHDGRRERKKRRSNTGAGNNLFGGESGPTEELLGSGGDVLASGPVV